MKKYFSTFVVVLSLIFIGHLAVGVYNAVKNVSSMVEKAAAAADVN